MTKKKLKKLYRVDIKLKYLTYVPNEPIKDDVFSWLEDLHDGEFDDDGSLRITEVNSVEQISDFEKDYLVYGDDSEEESVETLIETLGLDASIMIEKLQKLGYRITKP
jgi:hypothetical protein